MENAKRPVETKPVTNETKGSGIPPIVKVGIVVVIVLVVIGGVINVLFKLIAPKLAGEMVKKGIESQTGLKVDSNSNGEKFTITDKKSGTQINIGDTTIPADFPKDFPLYPGAKANGTVSGNKQDQISHYLSMTTPDVLSEVKSFYEESFPSNGWAIDETYGSAETVSYSVTKGNLKGTIVLSQPKDDKETGMIIMLETNTDTSNDSPAAPEGE